MRNQNQCNATRRNSISDTINSRQTLPNNGIESLKNNCEQSCTATAGTASVSTGFLSAANHQRDASAGKPVQDNEDLQKNKFLWKDVLFWVSAG